MIASYSNYAVVFTCNCEWIDENIQLNPYTMDFTPIEETLTEFDNLGIYVYD